MTINNRTFVYVMCLLYGLFCSNIKKRKQQKKVRMHAFIQFSNTSYIISYTYNILMDKSFVITSATSHHHSQNNGYILIIIVSYTYILKTFQQTE